MLVGAGTIQVRSPVMENGYGIIKKNSVKGWGTWTVPEDCGRVSRASHMSFPFSESRILTKTYPDCFPSSYGMLARKDFFFRSIRVLQVSIQKQLEAFALQVFLCSLPTASRYCGGFRFG